MIWRIVFSAAVSFLVLALLLRLVREGGEGSQAAGWTAVMRSVSLPLLGGYAVCTLFQTILRAFRYRLLLGAAGISSVPGAGTVFLVTAARNMFVDLFPARLGELSYIALLNRGCRVSGAACTSSLAISIIFDFLGLAVILALLAVWQLATEALPARLAVVTAGLVVAGAAGLAVVIFGARWAERVARRVLAGRGRAADALSRFAARLAEAVEATRRAGVMGRTLLLSVGVRVGKYLGFYLAFLAVASRSFPEMAAASMWKVIVTLLGAEAASALPLPTFMSFGSYEAGGTMAWKALGFDASAAAVVMLAIHVCSQAVDYAIGGLGLGAFLWRTRVPDVEEQRRPVRRWVAAAATGAVVFALMGYAWSEYRGIEKRGTLQPPPPGHDVSPSSVLRPPSSPPQGYVVWSSNRSGNHEIWMMSLPDGDQRQLTSNPRVDTYPRISPDGRRVVFARSQQDWVSQRNESPWDVYVLYLESGTETLVATNANAPMWSGPHTITFQRHGGTVVEHVLEKDKKRVLFESGQGGIPEGCNLQTPSYNASNGVLAVTLRGAKRMTALVGPDGAFRRVAGGCQLAWTPDRQSLLYVDSGGHMKNRIYRVDPATLERTALFDAPGAWSHEYFPMLSNDGRYLVYGAAARGHEHDTADYEIFLAKVGDAPENTLRLTHHTGNDCWPDIWIEP
jgi:uncharacterized membrane protein YbhN (UPF0104 family)